MDESNGTCNKRFSKAGILQTTEARRGQYTVATGETICKELTAK
jgi:fructose-bisphosphate aldolase class 1